MPIVHRPFSARPNRGSALVMRHNGSALYNNAATEGHVARQNVFILLPIAAIFVASKIYPGLSKSGRYKKASRLVAKYQVKYEKCAARIREKGRTPYPKSKEKGKLLQDTCKGEYLKLKHWERKLITAAGDYRDKLESKGKLTPELKKEFDKILRKANEVNNLEKKKVVAAEREAYEEEVEALTEELVAQDTGSDIEVDASGQKRSGAKRRRAKKKAQARLGPPPTEETIAAETKAEIAADPESAAAAAEVGDDEDEEGGLSTTAMVAIGVGGLVVLGAGAYFLLRKPDATV